MNATTPASAFANKPPSRRGMMGSRPKLAQRFFEDLYASWEEVGVSSLARAAFHDPLGYSRMVAQLMPQKLEIITPIDTLSDEKLAIMLEHVERMASLIEPPMQPARINHENHEIITLEAKGGGGPDAFSFVGGGASPSTLRPTADEPPPLNNDNNLFTSAQNGPEILTGEEDVDPESLF